MRILVTGVEGQLARGLSERASGVEVIRVGRPELDLEVADTIERTVRAIAPDVVVSAAAFTAVDRAEDEPERAMRVNGQAPGVLARAARTAGARIIHVSTDYVYDGTKADPYVETDPVRPCSVYGRTKLEGEERVRAAHPEHVVVRTAWVYSPYGSNFVRTMLQLARTRDHLSVVDDQYGNPTCALDLAEAILAILQRWQSEPNAGLGQTYHCAGAGAATWCGLARHTFEASQRSGGPIAKVAAITTRDWPTRALRPANSRLDCRKLEADFGWRAPDWRVSIDAVVRRVLAEHSELAA